MRQLPPDGAHLINTAKSSDPPYPPYADPKPPSRRRPLPPPVVVAVAIGVLGVATLVFSLSAGSRAGGSAPPGASFGSAHGAHTSAGATSAPEDSSTRIPLDSTEPVIDSNFPDPKVIKFKDTFYAYATNIEGAHVPVATASTLAGPWQPGTADAMPRLGAWARAGRTWAPDISPRSDGSFLLYYTAHRRHGDEECIGVAIATSPAGPFTPVDKEPLVCPVSQGGAIDAAAFVDSDGTRYLLYKSDGFHTPRPSALYLQRMNPDGVTRSGNPVRILTWDRHLEPSLVEAPALVRQGDRYVLFYAAGVFYNSSYQTRYATAASITGPYTKASAPVMSTAGFDGKVIGPGGSDLVRDGADDYIVFHGIIKTLPRNRVKRGMYVANLGWAGGLPVVRGHRTRYEAEKGRLNNARIRAARASQGQVVGRLDHEDSWVQFDVFAPVTGTYSLQSRYANQSPGPVGHELTVNGGVPISVVYPADRAGQWRTATIRTELKAGWNNIRLRHQKGSAELDYLEIA